MVVDALCEHHADGLADDGPNTFETRDARAVCPLTTSPRSESTLKAFPESAWRLWSL